jgi:predicted GH43/DUF377 family glycosyl hydrolase
MKIQFQKSKSNPVIPIKAGTFYSKYTANPDFLEFNGKYFLYFRGQDENGFDQIGVSYATMENFDGENWQIPDENPIIPVSKNPKNFDSGYILDPAAIKINNQVYLFYTAHRSDWQSWNIPSHIGLAISDDGFHFNKYDNNPIIEGMAPEVVEFNDKIYLFCQRINQKNGFDIFCCTSEDGTSFKRKNEKKIFGASGILSEFDGVSVSTVRIWRENDWFFMFYGGNDKFRDYPIAFGLARSKDLLNWERYPHNPILERGAPGEWDEGAMWFATVHRLDNTYYLWYEGTGTGLCQTKQANVKKSIQCREEDYGGYGIDSFSQIGLATFDGNIAEWN